ncbi:hypothetical protein O181_052404 [Austropuccinia psidii MF-1]|uniref:Photolyase/cryptochrome alpha/beta domain-containing protein n=1 Tax=Austropuccinia psidii MF-1 TaxID=1389203 RepID=A0A9Q3E0K8_9BASI|nr:hypothetical protein [Austropuccinia psidii MF-1]
MANFFPRFARRGGWIRWCPGKGPPLVPASRLPASESCPYKTCLSAPCSWQPSAYQQSILFISSHPQIMVASLKRSASSEISGLAQKHQKSGQQTPYEDLLQLLDKREPSKRSTEDKGRPVVYWMRMRDLRLSDNRALAVASQQARNQQGHLVVLHVFSPGDYRAHDRSPRRIDFVLRNLVDLRTRLHSLNIPLYTVTFEPRKEIPQKVIDLIQNWGANHLFANIEHEIDELRRDIRVVKLGRDHKIEVDLFHDTCIVEPGKVLTKQNNPYSVFGPWQRNWANLVNSNFDDYIESAAECGSNNEDAKTDNIIGKLFESEVPSFIPGFQLSPEEIKAMKEHWKEGEQAAQDLLQDFLHTPIKSPSSHQTTLTDDAKSKKRPAAVIEYSTLRNRPDLPGTSKLSAYLAAGVISPRACIRASFGAGTTKPVNKLQVDRRDLGVGVWQSELGWRDFYQHVLAAWPRVSMGKAFHEQYEKMVWEHDEKFFQKWKDGMTGYPFIDACMRQLKQLGYMHNRGRMCVAMFLTKDLMMDWHLGEKWFMQNLVDGDLGSNNGGWQWSSSTGTDSQPYFRIFAPLAQSEKSDPNGDFIRYWVPELKSLSAKNIHDPFHSLSKEKFEKLNYPKPMVDHAVVRKRALARYKNPGCSDNE